MVIRQDLKVETMGQMAELPPDLSPLQIGTRGVFEGMGFTLIGRVRVVYSEGSWNEWCALFANGSYGWVAESQGFFAVSTENTAPAGLPAADQIQSGQVLQVDQQPYRVIDQKETVCLGSEGELPFPAPVGRRGWSVDLAGPNAQFAGIEYSDEKVRFFIGRYLQFDDLSFTQLRPVPGWSTEAMEAPRGTTTALNCPNCGAAVSLRAAGLTMSAACGSCGSLLDTSTPDLKLIQKARSKVTVEPQIPIGARGGLFNTVYEVIGFQRVRDPYSSWIEYLLFNPWQGFAWLVTYNGHWSFVRRLLDLPLVQPVGLARPTPIAFYQGEQYRLFAQSPVKTDFVLGEFYWRVQIGMPVQVSDFVKPPFLLSRETYPQLQEETWSRGEYIEPAVIEEAFNLESSLPEPEGSYLNQPNPYGEKNKQLLWLLPLILLLLCAVQGVSWLRAARKEVFAANYHYRAGTTNTLELSEPFEIQGGDQAVDFAFHAPVDNSWLEVEVDLVDVTSHQAVASFAEGIEYYQGHDSDGDWSEGNSSPHHMVSLVPPGKYQLAIQASADPAVAEMPYSVSVVRDVVVWSNFWIAAILVLIYPLYSAIRQYSFEYRRWQESDYSPYSSSGGSDDD
jgi:hypothetical protein